MDLNTLFNNLSSFTLEEKKKGIKIKDNWILHELYIICNIYWHTYLVVFLTFGELYEEELVLEELVKKSVAIFIDSAYLELILSTL